MYIALLLSQCGEGRAASLARLCSPRTVRNEARPCHPAIWQEIDIDLKLLQNCRDYYNLNNGPRPPRSRLALHACHPLFFIGGLGALVMPPGCGMTDNARPGGPGPPRGVRGVRPEPRARVPGTIPVLTGASPGSASQAAWLPPAAWSRRWSSWKAREARLGRLAWQLLNPARRAKRVRLPPTCLSECVRAPLSSPASEPHRPGRDP